jgi:hypothetical protein
MRKPLFVFALLLQAAAAHAQAPADFAWLGTLELPAGASVVRAALPAEALLRVQSPQAADVRVFDAKGHALPFAFAAPVDQPLPARQPTAAFAALPLYTAQPGQRPGAGSVQVQITQGGEQQSVWVRTAPAAPAAAADRQLPSVIFDTRASKQTIEAIIVKAQVPPNAPVRLALSESTDLAHWSPVFVRGRVFRFEGEGAPANDTLELGQPLALEGRYLRLDWSGQDGVSVASIQGLAVRAARAPKQVNIYLPPPRSDGPQALEWQLTSALPLARLGLATSQANTLVPVRILGRNQAGEPWRVLANTVIYHFKSPEGPSTNLPVALPHQPVRMLRVEATNGQQLQDLPLGVTAYFDPVEVVFVAGGSGPYQLAAGRPQTQANALPLATITAAVGAKPEDLPVARITTVVSQPLEPQPAWARWLPEGVDSRKAALWAVLIAGVTILGVVAWSLLHQLGNKPAAEET